MKDISSGVLADLFEGGAGSGNWGHKGRPGHRGGSLGGGGRSIAVKLVHKDYPSEFIIVHRSTKQPGKWQASQISDYKGDFDSPSVWGDTQHSSMDHAVNVYKRKGYKVGKGASG